MREWDPTGGISVLTKDIRALRKMTHMVHMFEIGLGYRMGFR